MSKIRDKAFWERLVQEVQGGASQLSVAKRHGVTPQWLGHWCKKVAAQPRLLPVRVVEERTRRIELAVGAFRLSFEEGTEVEYLAALARVLS